jgi:hypothetical protein
MTLTNQQVKRAAAYFEAWGFKTEVIQDAEFGPQLLVEAKTPDGKLCPILLDNIQVAMFANCA